MIRAFHAVAFLLVALSLYDRCGQCAAASVSERAAANSSTSGSFLVWQFCHFSRGVQRDWNVTTSGLFVTTPRYAQSDVSSQRGYYTLLSISGSRVQATANGTQSQLVTGIAPYSTFGGNDNTITTSYPFLSPTGLSYSLDRSVVVPGTSVASNRINLYMFNSPPIENQQRAADVGLAYFVYTAGNAETSFPCPPPSVQLYSFVYTAAPTTYDNGLFSSCASGVLSLLGPYTYTDFLTGEQFVTYIVEDATGTRVYAAAGELQQTSIVGVSSEGGTDFTLYQVFPYADQAGISVTVNASSAALGQAGQAWLQMMSPDGQSMVETNLASGDNRMDISVAPYDGSAPLMSCPLAIASLKWDFCFISAGEDSQGTWAVIMTGTLLTAASIDQLSYYATAAQGERVQIDGRGNVTVTGITGVQSINGDPTIANDNRLYMKHPILSDAGLTLVFDDSQPPVQLPYNVAKPYQRVSPVWFTTLAGSPATEKYVDQSLVSFSTFVYQPSEQQFNLSAPSTVPCALPQLYQSALDKQDLPFQSNVTKATLAAVPATVTLHFYYAATPVMDRLQERLYGSTWSVCSYGSLQAIGPYTYGQQTVYQIVSVDSGSRTFLDSQGVASISTITGIAQLGGANQLLYMHETPYVDNDGITFALSGNPVFPSGESSVDWVHLSNGSGETTAVGVPTSVVTFFFSSNESAVGTCAQPGVSLSSSQQASVMVLAAAVPLLGIWLSVHSVELMYAALRRSQLGALLGWLTLSIAAVGFSTWAGILTYFASIELTCANCVTPLTLAYRTDYILLGWLPSIVGVALAIGCMVASLKHNQARRVSTVRIASNKEQSTVQRASTEPSVDRNSLGSSTFNKSTRISETEQYPSLEQEPDRMQWLNTQYRKAALTLSRLILCASYHVLLGGVALAAALILTRVTLTYITLTQADTTTSTAADVFGAIIVYALSCATLLTSFYAPYFRWLSSVLLTAALLIDCQLHFGTDQVSYQPHIDGASAQSISRDSVLLITGLTGAACFAATVLTSLYRFRAARRRLAAQMRHTANKLNSAESRIASQRLTIGRLTVLGMEAVKSLDAIAVLRPSDQDAGGKAGKDYRILTQDLLWCYNGPASLDQSALSDSARLIAPLLFSAGSAASARTSRAQTIQQLAKAASETGAGTTTGAGASSSAPNGTTVNSWTGTERASISVESQHSTNDSTTPLVVVSSPVLSTHALSPHSVDGPPDSPLSQSTFDPVITAGLEKLAKCLVVESRKGEELLLQGLTTIASQAVTDTNLIAAPLLQHISQGSTDGEVTAALSAILAVAAIFNPTLDHVLSHPVCAELLKDHMQQAASVENILFLAQLSRWKRTSNPSLRRRLAQLIMDEFIAVNSVHQVNLASRERDALQSTLLAARGGNRFSSSTAALPPHLFAQAEKEVRALVLTNNWKTFARSVQYGMCKAILVRNTVIMTAQHLHDDGGMRAVQESTDQEIDGLDVPDRKFIEQSEAQSQADSGSRHAEGHRLSVQPALTEEQPQPVKQSTQRSSRTMSTHASEEPEREPSPLPRDLVSPLASTTP